MLKFGIEEYGQMVLCSDASDPWRKDFFLIINIVENMAD